MVMPGRKYPVTNDYRYGFNGKENDNEVKGQGNQIDYGLRIYDSRVGKFLSCDPFTREYPFYTPYQYAGNKPIWCIDLDGAEDVEYQNGADYRNKFGEKTITRYEKCVPYDSYSCHDVVTIPNGQAVTQNLTEKQIYRLAVVRVLSAGQIKISDNQYLDEKYYQAEGNINQFLSELITTNTPNTEYWRKKSSELQGLVLQGIFNDDDNTANLSIQQIKNRLSLRAAVTSNTSLKTMATLAAGGIASWTRALGSSISKTLANLGIPKGFGIFADASKFRIAAANMTEQIAMKEAMSGQGSAIMGTGTNKALGDPRLAGMNVTKYEFTHKGTDVLGNEVNTTIHYLKNNETGVLFDFKFTQ